MFKIRKRKEAAAEAQSNSLLANVSGKLDRIQHRWANSLQRQSERLTVTGKKVLLLLFLALFGSGSLYIGLQALHPQSIKSPMVMDRITLPRSAQGRWTLDSTIRARPGLLDSVRQMEKVYLEQPKR